jgi:hypothetical protein
MISLVYKIHLVQFALIFCIVRSSQEWHQKFKNESGSAVAELF